MLLIHPALRLGTLLLHYIIAISSFFVLIHVFFFILRSFTVGCGKSKIFASPVLFLLFSFFLLLFSVIFLFLNEINDDDDDDENGARQGYSYKDRPVSCIFKMIYRSLPFSMTFHGHILTLGMPRRIVCAADVRSYCDS